MALSETWAVRHPCQALQAYITRLIPVAVCTRHTEAPLLRFMLHPSSGRAVAAAVRLAPRPGGGHGWKSKKPESQEAKSQDAQNSTSQQEEDRSQGGDENDGPS